MLKTIATFRNEIEAGFFRERLESASIRSFIFKDDCGGTRPHLQLTAGVEIKVDDVDFESAEAILKTYNEEGLEQADEFDTTKTIGLLLNRARGWILVGFAIIPGWISFPISFIYSTLAHKRYKEAGIKDDAMKNKILRIQFTSAFFAILFWLAAIIYFSTFRVQR